MNKIIKKAGEKGHVYGRFLFAKSKIWCNRNVTIHLSMAKKNTSLKVAFISYGVLEKEEISNEFIHGFSNLSLIEQKRKVKQLKKEFDIIIYDASSQVSEGVLKLLPIVDRLFIVGDENRDFAVKLHDIIQFDKLFDNSVKNFIAHLEGNKTFILRESMDQRVIGFTNSKKETDDIGQMIYTDYVTFYIERKFIEKNKKVFNKIKKIPREELYIGRRIVYRFI